MGQRIHGGAPGEISFDEFVEAVAPHVGFVEKLARARVRASVSLGVNFVWIFGGAQLFASIEGWTYVKGLYFVTVTLTTIGLGDVVPATEAGEDVHFFYCAIGLGLLAVLISASSEFLTKVWKPGQGRGGSVVARAWCLHVCGCVCVCVWATTAARGLDAAARVFARDCELNWRTAFLSIALIRTHAALCCCHRPPLPPVCFLGPNLGLILAHTPHARSRNLVFDFASCLFVLVLAVSGELWFGAGRVTSSRPTGGEWPCVCARASSTHTHARAHARARASSRGRCCRDAAIFPL